VRSVLISGASTGIGRATALRLDAAGWRVFAGVRKESDAESLRAAGSERIAPLTLDVTDGAQIAAAAERIGAETDRRLDGLVNNAGVAIPGPLETLAMEDFRRQIEVNMTAHVAVTQAMLPAIRPARGRIVFISSIGGLVALPLTGAYHAAKFGIEAVGDIFRQELRPWGIKVAIVEPGSIDTPIWERGERTADELATPEREELYGKVVERYRKVIRDTAERGIPAEKVAETIEHALTASRPHARYLIGLEAKMGARLRQLLPTRVFDAVVRRQMNL
jgi:NAD(P)-dependent dehydrogenase (short-subunit alcohol dehydrogenase family)